jgi:proteasome activator subunit 4
MSLIIDYLATIIVYSMHEDSPIAPPSGMATPFAPDPAESPFYPGARPLQTTFIAGSKALDSLIKFIVSTESFFHPSNSGSWTSNVSDSNRPYQI